MSFGLGQGAKKHHRFTQGEDGKREREKQKLMEIENPEYNDGIRDDVRNRIKRLNNNLKVRQESIDLLKGRVTNQIMGIKETITKVLDRDTSLAKKIQMLFRKQGIMITSILMAIGMTISSLVKALLPGGVAAQGGSAGKTVGKPDNVKEWLRNKLKALALLLGRLNTKLAEALPAIIGAIVSWILNRVKEIVGWILQNLWALIIGVGGLLYMYMVMRK